MLAPEQRLKRAPSGKPTRLAKAEMPPPDAFICWAAHKGGDRILMDCIDPAVTDENDPANGFAEPPNPSPYSDDFLRRFRAGQRTRVERLDARAHALIREARHNEPLYKETKETLPFEQRQRIGRRAAQEQVMVVYRTMAHPLYIGPRSWIRRNAARAR